MEKIILVGYSRMAGLSTKSNPPKPFDMSKLYILDPLVAEKREGFEKECGGFEGIDVDVDSEVFTKLKGKTFPLVCALVTEASLRYGKLQTRVVDVVNLSKLP